MTLAIPMFVMSCFKISMTFCIELESLMANFWWGQKDFENKIHWIGWDNMCIPKFRDGWVSKTSVLLISLFLLNKGG